VVTPIRPSLTPPTASPAGPVRTAAQRAFFDAAMGRAAPTAAATPAIQTPAVQAAPVAPVRAAMPAPQPAANPTPDPGEPVRYRRPGSLLDIKV
jgi:hypothetical protein